MNKIFIICLLLITGCSKSYIIEQPVITKADTTVYTPRIVQKDTSEVESSGIPVEFDVTVESWE